MSLDSFWFIVIAFLWTGFFVLEGFDFGVGVLHGVVGADEASGAPAISTDRPVLGRQRGLADRRRRGDVRRLPRLVRDDVLRLLPGALLLLVALIVRGVVLRVPRQAGQPPRGGGRGTWLLTVGSLLAPLLIGVALGNLLHGLPIDSSQEYTGDLLDLLSPYALWVGATFVVVARCTAPFSCR